MIIQFCPQCGEKVEAAFIFCASCGAKLPKQEPEEITPSAATQVAGPPANEAEIEKGRKQNRRKMSFPVKKELPESSPSKEAASPKRKIEDVMTPEASKITSLAEIEKGRKQNRRKMSSPVKKELPESSPSKEAASPKRKIEDVMTPEASKITSLGKSPQGKRIRKSMVEPLPENEILTDLNTKSWQLVRLLTHNESGMLYEAKSTSGASAQEHRYLLKLDAKDGRIFHEQNFFQRAVKSKAVQMWQKSHSISFLGIPTCIGFGLHGEKYRFLVFPDFGRSLQSILDTSKKTLSEKAVFQISYRMMNALEYIHENEYAHGDIKAENVFVSTDDPQQVYLAGYGFAFRYCPGGKHVEYREGSRTPHEGTVEFASLDSHKGAGLSCRSDLESLGYCMVKWLTGSLPWCAVLERPKEVMEQKQKYKEDIASFLKQCFGKRKIPDVLKAYLEHVMSLNYEEKPNYEELKKTFQEALKRMKAMADDPVDLPLTP